MLLGMLDPTTFATHRHRRDDDCAQRVRQLASEAVELSITHRRTSGAASTSPCACSTRCSCRRSTASPRRELQAVRRQGRVPFVSDEEAERVCADQGGMREVRPYLRYARDPSLRLL